MATTELRLWMTDWKWLVHEVLAPLEPYLKFRLRQISKQDLVKVLVRDFGDEQLEAMIKLLSDIRLETRSNPLSRFRKGRTEQMEFIESTHRITIALCGNRWGKTIAMMYHLCSTATGKNPDAKHHPDPSRPLRVWVIGESWPVLNDTILKEITGLLRPDQYETKKQNSYVSSIIIKAPNGGETHVRLIPSGEDGDQKFESAALHYVYIDEGIRASLFRQIIFRTGDSDGQIFQAFTRLPENMHLADYLIDLEDGEGEFAELLRLGYIKIIHGYTKDNIYNTKDDIAFLEASVSGDEEQRQARLYGRVDRPKGAVFNYRGTVRITNDKGVSIERPYNDFTFNEFFHIASREEGRWDLLHDDGQAAPASWILVWTSRVTGTSYFVDCVYKAGMSIQESSERAYDMMMRWECYVQVKKCFADKSILQRGRAGERNEVEITTYQQYRDRVMPNGDYCFPPKMKWVMRQRDKNNRRYTLSILQELLETENPLTPNLPYLRFSARCKAIKKELRFLRWFRPKKHTQNVKREITEGDDHCIDPIRYFINNKINHTMWKRRKELRRERNEFKYAAGGSMVPFFKI